uniref:Uncharacterized protein n=1 Tax=Solanum tuberosum TaxID=4113 RepID=M1DVC8_SOLTU
MVPERTGMVPERTGMVPERTGMVPERTGMIEGRNQIGDKKEQSAHHQIVSQCCDVSPNVTKPKDVERQGDGGGQRAARPVDRRS